MRIEQLMTKSPRTCRPNHTLSDAAHMMWDEDCGCLPVTAADGSQRLLGMISDRDVCMALRFDGRSPREPRVEDAMTKVVHPCKPGDPIAEAGAIMCEERVRRLPVVDDSDQVIGVISLADLALEAARQASWEKPQIASAYIAALLATICQPRKNESDAPFT
jgi:CBS domain-containing protein